MVKSNSVESRIRLILLFCLLSFLRAKFAMIKSDFEKKGRNPSCP